MSNRISFIGGGNMARSIIGGLLAAGVAAADVTVSEPDADARERLAALGPLTLTADNEAAVASADLVVLAVKPQLMHRVLAPLAPALARRQPTCLSIAAGVPLDALVRWGGPLPWIRCMPNTPALVGAGMSVLCATTAVGEASRALATTVMEAAGAVRWVEDETAMDAVTAVSGSGPAYFFQLMEAMIDAGRELGLDAELARALVLQTAVGAARMASETGTPPAELRRQVTSPGGTTAAALETFAEGDLAGWVGRGVNAAARRSGELAAATLTDPET